MKFNDAMTRDMADFAKLVAAEEALGFPSPTLEVSRNLFLGFAECVHQAKLRRAAQEAPAQESPMAAAARMGIDVEEYLQG